MPSAQLNAAFVFPFVEEVGNGKACFADVSGKVFHLNDKFNFAFAIKEDFAQKVLQVFFRCS